MLDVGCFQAARDCAFDYCMTPDDIVQETLCNDFEEYVAACEEALHKSLDFDWRANHGCRKSVMKQLQGFSNEITMKLLPK